MERFFHEDNVIIKMLGTLCDLLLLNLLTLLCCLPVITAGASLTAMHYVLVHAVEQKQGYLIPSFFQAFRKNFMQSTIMWMMILGIASIAYAGFLVFFKQDTFFGYGVSFLAILGIMMAMILFIYAFPLQARYENSIHQTMSNAVRLAFSHVPQTGAMAAILIVYGSCFSSSLWQYVLGFAFLFGFTIPGWLYMKLYLPVLSGIEEAVS